MISRTLSGAGSIVRRWNWRGRSISNPASLNALVNELLKKHIGVLYGRDDYYNFQKSPRATRAKHSGSLFLSAGLAAQDTTHACTKASPYPQSAICNDAPAHPELVDQACRR